MTWLTAVHEFATWRIVCVLLGGVLIGFSLGWTRAANRYRKRDPWRGPSRDVNAYHGADER